MGRRGAAGEVIGADADADASGDGDRQSPLSPRFTPSFPIHATARISEDEERQRARDREAAAAAEGKKL